MFHYGSMSIRLTERQQCQLCHSNGSSLSWVMLSPSICTQHNRPNLTDHTLQQQVNQTHNISTSIQWQAPLHYQNKHGYAWFSTHANKPNVQTRTFAATKTTIHLQTKKVQVQVLVQPHPTGLLWLYCHQQFPNHCNLIH